MSKFSIFFIALLLSMFLHLEILQLRLETGQYKTTLSDAIDLELVALPSPYKTTSTILSESSPSQPSSMSGKRSSVFVDIEESWTNKPPVRERDLATPPDLFEDGDEILVTEKTVLQPSSALSLIHRQQPAAPVGIHSSLSVIAKTAEVDKLSVTVESHPDVVMDKGERISKDIMQAKHSQWVEPPVDKDSETSEGVSVGSSEAMRSEQSTTTNHVQIAIPRYDRNPRPVYPDIALRKGWEGIVLLRVDVEASGLVESVEIEKSSGFHVLDRAALRAVRRWQFIPAMSAGLPMDGSAMVPINFVIP